MLMKNVDLLFIFDLFIFITKNITYLYLLETLRIISLSTMYTHFIPILDQ